MCILTPLSAALSDQTTHAELQDGTEGTQPPLGLLYPLSADAAPPEESSTTPFLIRRAPCPVFQYVLTNPVGFLMVSYKHPYNMFFRVPALFLSGAVTG